MLIRRHTDKQTPLPIPQPVVVEKPKRKSRKKIEEKQEGTSNE